jgi:excisionase family DNA binding protein
MPANPRGLTVREIAARYRVGKSKVRSWIRRGLLSAIDTGEHGKSRYVVMPEALAEFEKIRTAVAPPARPRKRRTVLVDFYPEG